MMPVDGQTVCRMDWHASYGGQRTQGGVGVLSVVTKPIAGLGILATSLLNCMATAQAGDWPQWGGHDHRNMVASAKHLPAL